MPIAQRGTGWLNDTFHAHFREVMLHAAAREGFFCPTYCLMPDHIHLVWMGLRRESDQKNGMKFLREHLAPKLRPHQFQHQAHDHVLRAEQRKRNAFAKVCFYIIDNARKEELVEHPTEWKFCGAVIPGYPAMHPLEEDFWPKFWKLYSAALAPDAGKITRPPFQPVAADVSPLKLCDMLAPLKSIEERVSRLTSAATIIAVHDHATSEIASGSKLGIDATKKIPGEGFKRPLAAVDSHGRKRAEEN